MSDDIDEDELDGILEGALETFETTRRKTASTKPAAKNANDAGVSPGESSGNESAGREKVQAGEEDAVRAFEDAIKTLGDLNLEQPADDDALEEADLKLVEEFMSSLGASLGGMGAQDGAAAGAAPRGTDGAGSSAGPEVTPNMEKLVESIVGQLLSKDVLKTPMMQMRDSYARWLPANAERLTAEELGRYSRQQELVGEICERYEGNGDSGEIMELLSKMQETGAPPTEVMNELTEDGTADVEPGLSGLGAKNLDKMAERCEMQ